MARVWNRGAEVEVGGHADSTAAVVRRDKLMVELGQPANLADLADSVGHQRLGLNDVVAVALDHPPKLVEADVVLAASDVQVDPRAQPAEILEIPATQLL